MERWSQSPPMDPKLVVFRVNMSLQILVIKTITITEQEARHDCILKSVIRRIVLVSFAVNCTSQHMQLNITDSSGMYVKLKGIHTTKSLKLHHF